MHVLIADDEAPLRDLLKLSLSMRKMQVTAAADGADAVDAATAQPFDLILLDLHMPRLDGLAAARLIRATSHNAQTPIVFLTGDQQLEAGDLPHSGTLAKPFTMQHLARAIERALQPKTRA